MWFFNKDTTKGTHNFDDTVSNSLPTISNHSLYLVDYENVSDAGLVGVDKLISNDTVIIFYGSKVKTKHTNAAQDNSIKNKPANRSSRPKVVTKPQPKKTNAGSPRPTVTDKQKAEIRAALKDAKLNAPDYKKVYDAFVSCDNNSSYNNKLQKTLGNDKTSVVYKATSKIFENAKK